MDFTFGYTTWSKKIKSSSLGCTKPLLYLTCFFGLFPRVDFKQGKIKNDIFFKIYSGLLSSGLILYYFATFPIRISEHYTNETLSNICLDSVRVIVMVAVPVVTSYRIGFSQNEKVKIFLGNFFSLENLLFEASFGRKLNIQNGNSPNRKFQHLRTQNWQAQNWKTGKLRTRNWRTQNWRNQNWRNQNWSNKKWKNPIIVEIILLGSLYTSALVLDLKFAFKTLGIYWYWPFHLENFTYLQNCILTLLLVNFILSIQFKLEELQLRIALLKFPSPKVPRSDFSEAVVIIKEAYILLMDLIIGFNDIFGIPCLLTLGEALLSILITVEIHTRNKQEQDYVLMTSSFLWVVCYFVSFIF